jgi:hypothetical protein
MDEPKINWLQEIDQNIKEHEHSVINITMGLSFYYDKEVVGRLWKELNDGIITRSLSTADKILLDILRVRFSSTCNSR